MSWDVIKRKVKKLNTISEKLEVLFCLEGKSSPQPSSYLFPLYAAFLMSAQVISESKKTWLTQFYKIKIAPTLMQYNLVIFQSILKIFQLQYGEPI